MNTDGRVRTGVIPILAFLAAYQRSSVFISGSVFEPLINIDVHK
jgi:hypothetical protein